VAAKLAPLRQDLQRTRSELQAHEGDGVVEGGQLVLVPTDKPISEWEPVARRDVPNMYWVWKGDLFADSAAA